MSDFTPYPKPERMAPRKPVPVKRKNTKRHKKEWLRAYGNLERVLWVKAQPCVVDDASCALAIHNVHVVGDGAGRKADADKIVPMCGAHHDDLHRIGREDFEKLHHVDLPTLAAEYDRTFSEHYTP